MLWHSSKAYNCKLAAKVLDRLMIAPGETFSFWNAVRGADQEMAYKMGMFCLMGGSSFCRGGGLCQMSSFLYWLFLHTPLTITEQHTYGVDLHLNMPGIPQGIDAAVAEGWLDLKIKNNTAHTFQLLVAVDSHNMSGTVLSDTRLRPVCQKQIS